MSSSLSVDGSEQTLASTWRELLEKLPEDWSHLLLEVEILSGEPYHHAAIIVEALNPARCSGKTAFHFRVARDFGYGASTGLAAARLRQLDEAGFRGSLRLLETLAERRPLDTQGPVWRPARRPQ